MLCDIIYARQAHPGEKRSAKTLWLIAGHEIVRLKVQLKGTEVLKIQLVKRGPTRNDFQIAHRPS